MNSNQQIRSLGAPLERGALLVEMLVAFALVSTTLIALLSAFLTLQRGYRIELARKDTADALTYAIEDIVREARVSDRYGDGHTTGTYQTWSTPFTMQRIAALNSQGASSVTYATSTLNGASGVLFKTVHDASGTTLTNLPLTPPAVDITHFQFTVFGEPDERRRAVLSIVATPKNAPAGAAPVYLQTTLTERGF